MSEHIGDLKRFANLLFYEYFCKSFGEYRPKTANELIKITVSIEFLPTLHLIMMLKLDEFLGYLN